MAKPDRRSDFHKAYMKPTAACPSGFFRQGPPRAEAAAAVRQNRSEAMRSLHPRQEEKPGEGWGAEVCACAGRRVRVPQSAGGWVRACLATGQWWTAAAAADLTLTPR